MLPDFHGLLRQSGNSEDLRSLKPRSDESFSTSKSFQQFNKNRDRGSDRPPFGGVDHTFFHLWLAQPSWSPIILTEHGWQTVKNNSGKKVPLTLGSIASNFRRNIVIGKRFGKLTNYLMLDVDAGSLYHPKRKGLARILDTLEDLGLCRYLPIQSSDSGGLHLYFPLPTPVNAWALSRTVHAALSRAGVGIKNGQCELFPNKKALGAEHNGHRLPLQAGSFILDDDFRCLGNDKARFLQQWQLCAAGQDEARLTQALNTLRTTSVDSLRALPPIAWTAIGESNDIMRQLVNYGDRVMGLKTIPELGDWITEVAPKLPGYDRFASEETKHDLARRDWAYRWAKSHFKNCRNYAARNSLDYNATVAAEAKERLFITLQHLTGLGEALAEMKMTALWKRFCTASKRLFGRGFSWRLFKKHLSLVLNMIKGAGKVGLSRRWEEDKNLSLAETVKPETLEGSKEAFGNFAQLLTLRWVTSIYSKALSQFPTPLNQTLREGGCPATQGTGAALSEKKAVNRVGQALDIGVPVTVVMPGGQLNGMQTTVVAIDRDILGQRVYRLALERQRRAVSLPRECLQRVEVEPADRAAETAVIRATAQQLLQVLGKACPFVGPGLWTVKRDEVPAKAWGQLCRLIGEM